MQIRLFEGQQKSDDYYTGLILLKDLVSIFKDYPFEEDVVNKAKIHKSNMKNGIPPFKVTIRIQPGGSILKGEEILFECSTAELYDSKSKVAAVCRMEEEDLGNKFVMADILSVTKEKMEKLQKNQL